MLLRSRGLALVVAALGLCGALTACSGEERLSPDSTVGPGTTIADPTGSGPFDTPAYSDASQPIYVALGRRFALLLDSEPSAGNSWQVANSPDAAVVVPLGTQFRSTNPGVPGAPAKQYLTFAASGMGQTLIEVRYVSPNGETVPGTLPVRFDVTVTFTGEPPPPPPPGDGTTLVAD